MTVMIMVMVMLMGMVLLMVMASFFNKYYESCVMNDCDAYIFRSDPTIQNDYLFIY